MQPPSATQRNLSIILSNLGSDIFKMLNVERVYSNVEALLVLMNTMVQTDFNFTVYLLTQICANTLKSARTRGSSTRSSPIGSLRTDRSDRLWRPVRPVLQRTPRKPKTSSSGGTPLELVDLGLLWGRYATQNILERRRDERRIADEIGKVRFGGKK